MRFFTEKSNQRDGSFGLSFDTCKPKEPSLWFVVGGMETRFQ